MPLKRQSTADGRCPLRRTSSRQRLELFVAEYLIDLNATRAAIAAGYSPKTAGQQGSRLLKNVKVLTEIAGKTKERIARLEITADNVLNELAKLAFFDPRKFFKPDGSAIPITELDDDTAMALAGFEMIEHFLTSASRREEELLHPPKAHSHRACRLARSRFLQPQESAEPQPRRQH